MKNLPFLIRAAETIKQRITILGPDETEGVRKERIEELVQAGVDLRNQNAVRAHLAAQGAQPASALPSPTNVATGDPELERAKAKIEAMAAKASPGPTTPLRAPAPPAANLVERKKRPMPVIESTTNKLRQNYTSGGRPMNLLKN
jgi:hypothetical protein